MATLTQVHRAIAPLVAGYPHQNGKSQPSMAQFLKLVENVLEAYPGEVLEVMVSPRRGIMAQCEFFPSIAEIKKFCDKQWDILRPRAAAEDGDDIRRLSGPAENSAAAEARRQANLAALRSLMQELRANDSPRKARDTEPDMETADERLARWAREARTQALPKLSAEAMAIFNQNW